MLSGTADEQWAVSFERLLATYTYGTGEEILPEDLGLRIPQSDDLWVEVRPRQGSSAPCVFVYQTALEDQVQVTTAWGEVLTANRPGVPPWRWRLDRVLR